MILCQKNVQSHFNVLYEGNEGLKLFVGIIWRKKKHVVKVFSINKGRCCHYLFPFLIKLYIDAQMIVEQVIELLMAFQDFEDGLNARGFLWLCAKQ